MRKPSTMPCSACAAWSSITSVSGHAADVRVMSMIACWFSSRSTPYTRPRSTTLMPSSGSMTSRRASSTSAAVATLSAMICSSRLRDRIAQGHPAQQRALDTRRILPHSGERRRIAEEVLALLVQRLALVVHERLEGLEELVDALHALPHDQVVEDRHGGLGDRAALPLPREVGDGVAVQADAQGHLVAAGRVDLVRLAHGGRGEVAQAAAVRLSRVVEDDLLVHPFEVAHAVTPKNSMTRSRPAMNASTSASVV